MVRIAQWLFALSLWIRLSGNVYADDALDRWHKRSSVAPKSVRFLNGMFVGVGNNIVVSVDGSNWTSYAIGPGETLKNVFYETNGLNSKFIAVGTTVYTSADGTNWVRSSSVPPEPFTDIAWSSSALSYVATCEHSGSMDAVVYYSTNLQNWTSIVLPDPSHQVHASITDRVISIGSRFVVIGGGGFDDYIWVSTGGLTWQYSFYANQYPGGFIFANNQLVFVGNEGCPLISNDRGITWSNLPKAGYCSDCLSCTYGFGVAYGNQTYATVYFALGLGGLSSTNLQTWTYRSALAGKSLYSIAYGASSFVAAGPDGIYQTDLVSIPALSLERKTNGLGFTVSVSGEVGRQYRIQYSYDLTSWQDERTFTNTLPTMQFDEPFDAISSKRFLRAVTP